MNSWKSPALAFVFLAAASCILLPCAARAAESPRAVPTIRIDAAKRGAPISELIYGQFIEHLGRCIYGGIWAEMLEDRKFFRPVGAEGSPWKPLGEATVTMDQSEPFVGRHTPLIAGPGGIGQGGLGLVEGKRYVGRVWLKGPEEAGPVTVSLIWGDGPDQRQQVTLPKLQPAYVEVPFELTAGAGTDDARLELSAAGKGGIHVGTISLMPADNVDGMRADTLRLLKELDAPIYRWPGGNFVSGYDWRDGIGPRDRRPPRKNPAWQGFEHNDFGIGEFVHFCRLVGAEPLVTVNTGFGDAYSAAAELEYANGSTETPMGRLRAANGDAEPFGVRYWCIGNEMFGPWQLGYMKLDHYELKHNWVVDKMRQVDPKIVAIASGAAGPWSEGMLRNCGDHMNLIAEHFYRQGKDDLAEHVAQAAQAIREKAEAHRRYRETIPGLAQKDIRVAMTEWNYWYGPHIYGELGVRYYLKDALGIAAGLHEYYRNSDLFAMANYAQTVNVIGCIKTTKTQAAFATTGLVLKLYRRHYGQIPVEVSDASPLYAAGALTEDGKRLTLSIVNPTLKPQRLPLQLAGATLAGGGTRLEITGPGPMAYNAPGEKPQVVIGQKRVDRVGEAVEVAPCSVTLYVLDLR